MNPYRLDKNTSKIFPIVMTVVIIVIALIYLVSLFTYKDNKDIFSNISSFHFLFIFLSLPLVPRISRSNIISIKHRSDIATLNIIYPLVVSMIFNLSRTNIWFCTLYILLYAYAIFGVWFIFLDSHADKENFYDYFVYTTRIIPDDAYFYQMKTRLMINDLYLSQIEVKQLIEEMISDKELINKTLHFLNDKDKMTTQEIESFKEEYNAYILDTISDYKSQQLNKHLEEILEDDY